jgi:hypothetical protein
VGNRALALMEAASFFAAQRRKRYSGQQELASNNPKSAATRAIAN